ncbi:MAG: 2,3-bisphosphoglycerate-independent phosphoglycerate mutase [Candidatus Cloacimonetes bacterium]|jgi:2,3-bisphosphoglycerate-independent phosphoglycerate mutase|nr:2,3-bisphosphoglycerate-independent phosphoglycerate mutase [Candidatus Cloacimonadota bacterium]MDD4155636.1 2,3-bisphosphoglycerate-independent phosphoglycerate mutase [Candidatus Cloacimonadota bacterium]
MTNKLLLLILDGYGISQDSEGNAIKHANIPFLRKLEKTYPMSTLKTNGKDVGLPEGIMGNSEVGHLNIGAGRIVYQLNTLIDNKIETGEFFSNSALLSAIKHSKQNKSNLHLFGLLSDGGVHSSLTHLYAILDLCIRENFYKVYYHIFMDGRDTLPHSGIDFIKEYQKHICKLQKSTNSNIGDIASISGRYYAMDRDNRWERINKAYDALVFGKGNISTDPVLCISESYTNDITDEFIIPTVIQKDNKPKAVISDNDSIIFFNFRSDRPRELTRSFIFDDFREFPVKKFQNLKYVTMTEYDIKFDKYVEVAFRTQKLENILGQVIQDNNLCQLRLAETEKYAHVTFFFNGGVEQPFNNEERILVSSPKVASYDLQPEMSALEVTDRALDALIQDKYDLIIINFANCDMVGHTGQFSAVIKAVETINDCVEKIIPVAQTQNYHILVTADHGNAEQMIDENGNIMTAHSMNKVPFIVIHNQDKKIKLKDGKLGDIAPTILHLMNIKVPKEMTGQNLIKYTEINN